MRRVAAGRHVGDHVLEAVAADVEVALPAIGVDLGAGCDVVEYDVGQGRLVTRTGEHLARFKGRQLGMNPRQRGKGLHRLQEDRPVRDLGWSSVGSLRIASRSESRLFGIFGSRCAMPRALSPRLISAR